MGRRKKGFGINKIQSVGNKAPNSSWSVEIPKEDPQPLDYCTQPIKPAPRDSELRLLARKIPNADVFATYKSARDRWEAALSKYAEYEDQTTIDGDPYRIFYYHSCDSVSNYWEVRYRNDGIRDFGIDTGGAAVEDVATDSGTYWSSDTNNYICNGLAEVTDGVTTIQLGEESTIEIECFDGQIVCSDGSCSQFQIYIDDVDGPRGKITFPDDPNSEVDGDVTSLEGRNITYDLYQEVTDQVFECGDGTTVCNVSTNYAAASAKAKLIYSSSVEVITDNPPISFTVEEKIDNGYIHTWDFVDAGSCTTEINEYRTPDLVTSFSIVGGPPSSGTANAGVNYCSPNPSATITINGQTFVSNNPPIRWEYADAKQTTINVIDSTGIIGTYVRNFVLRQTINNPAVNTDYGANGDRFVLNYTWNGTSRIIDETRDINDGNAIRLFQDYGFPDLTTGVVEGTYNYATDGLPYCRGGTQLYAGFPNAGETFGGDGISSYRLSATGASIQYGYGVWRIRWGGVQDAFGNLCRDNTGVSTQTFIRRFGQTTTSFATNNSAKVDVTVTRFETKSQVRLFANGATNGGTTTYVDDHIDGATYVFQTLEIYDREPVTITFECQANWELTFQPQNQTFTFPFTCEPTNVVTNTLDPVCCNQIYSRTIQELDVTGVHNPPTIDCSRLGNYTECFVAGGEQIGFIDIGGVQTTLTQFVSDTPTASCITTYTLKVFDGSSTLIREVDVCGDPTDDITIYGFTSEFWYLTPEIDGVPDTQRSYEEYDPTSNENLFFIEALDYCEVNGTAGNGDPIIDFEIPSISGYTCSTGRIGTTDINAGPYTVEKSYDPTTNVWTLTVFDANGNIVQTQTYDSEPSINGENPNAPVQIDTTNQEPYVECTCPDYSRTLQYAGNEPGEGFVSDWSGTSAGAPNILGQRVCKHVYSVLNQLKVSDRYKPTDEPTGIVREENPQGSIGNQDASATFQPQRPRGFKQSSKRWF